MTGFPPATGTTRRLVVCALEVKVKVSAFAAAADAPSKSIDKSKVFTGILPVFERAPRSLCEESITSLYSGIGHIYSIKRREFITAKIVL
jgi:hypothetical protein